MPEAQLDRFLFKIEVGYPNLEEEFQILEGFLSRKNVNNLDLIQPVFTAQQVSEYREKVSEVRIDTGILRYIASIVESTRNHSSLYLGASPRASIAIMRSSQAIAAMSGRDFVTPDDVKRMTYPVLRHRVMLTPEKEMEGAGIGQVIKQIVENVEIPR